MVLSDTSDPSSSLVCGFVSYWGYHRKRGVKAGNQGLTRSLRSGSGNSAGRSSSAGPARELNESEKPRLASCNKCGERSFDCLESTGGNGHFKCRACGYQFGDFTRLAKMQAEAENTPISYAARKLNEEWARMKQQVEDPERRGDAIYIPQN